MKKIIDIIVLIFLLFSCGKNGQDSVLADCDINNGPCIKYLQKREIHFDINPKPVKPMKPLTFTLNLVNYEEEEFIIVDLSMPDMYMGFNQVVLSRKDSGSYKGNGIIPKCPHGKTLWKAKVLIKEEVQAEFLFHVQK